MFNPLVYGKTSSAPHLGVLGVSGLDWESILEQGKEKVKEVTGEDLTIPSIPDIPTLPSEEKAQEIGEQMAQTTGQAVGETVWTGARPFAIAGVVLLGGILLVVLLKRRKK